MLLRSPKNFSSAVFFSGVDEKENDILRHSTLNVSCNEELFLSCIFFWSGQKENVPDVLRQSTLNVSCNEEEISFARVSY